MTMRILICFLLFSQVLYVCAQRQGDTSRPISAIAISTTLLSYGIWGTYTKQGRAINTKLKSIVYSQGNHTTADNYLALTPAVAVYGLNIFGIKGKHNFIDRSTILTTSFIILTPVVFATKKHTNVLRPDGTSYASFPSGHTAVAFASAEFLRQEYKGENKWYGIAGYVVATSVGTLRMYNNRHWVSDVATGAGLGILSTQIATKVHPFLKEKLFPKTNKTSMVFTPTYSKNSVKLSFAMIF